MPIKSQAQREWLQKHKPEVAKKMEAKTKNARLPHHTRRKKGGK